MESITSKNRICLKGVKVAWGRWKHAQRNGDQTTLSKICKSLHFPKLVLVQHR